MGTAFLLHNNRAGREPYKIIGLTSTRNIDFVEQLSCYDQVLGYEQIELLDGRETAVLVDFTGSADLLAQIHTQFQSHMVYSCLVGFSHGEEAKAGPALPGAEPRMFFAPAQVQKRLKEWGGQGFQMRMAQAWTAFLLLARSWLTVREAGGTAVITELYQAFARGQVQPDRGYILSLHEVTGHPLRDLRP